MAFRIHHEFLYLGKRSEGFAKNYFYEWEDGLGGPPAQLFLNFECAQEDLPIQDLADGLFEVMKNHFFNDLERDPNDRFEDTLKEVNHLISQKEEEIGIVLIPELHVIAAALWDDTLFLSQRGDAEAYLIRKRYLSSLTEDLSDPKDTHELFSNIAQGALESDDVVLLNSHRLLRFISKSDLARLVSEESNLNGVFLNLEQMVSLDGGEAISILGISIGKMLEQSVIRADEDFEAEEEEESIQVAGGFRLKSVESSLKRWSEPLKLHLGRLIRRRSSKKQEPDNDEDFSKPMVETRRSILNEWRELKRDKILILLIVVVLILLVGIYMVRNQGRKQQLIDDLESKLEMVETSLNQAQTTGTYDTEAAQELLDESEVSAMEVLNSGYLRGKASEYLSRIEDQRDQLNHVTRIDNPTVFLDFSTVNPSMNALGLLALGDRYYVYNYNSLYEVVLDEIQEPLLIDLEEVIVDAAYHDDQQSILFLTKSNHVIEVKDRQVSFLDTEDGSWHSAVDLEIYNGRLYLLDPSQKQIWRYYPQREGFSGADAYVIDPTVDLSNAVSIAIDGSVFILKSDGSIEKLFGGETEEFIVKNQPSVELKGASLIDAEFERFQVFVLDPTQNSILVYNKDARSGNLVYNKQFILDNVESLKNLYVDKNANRLYVVAQTKVYTVDY